MEKSPVEISIVSKLKVYLRTYPSQFWLLFWGMLVSTTGMSMIWPFLVVYISEELTLPLTTITSLITINAVMSLSSSLIAGSITDKIGRKWAMAITGILAHVVGSILMTALGIYTFGLVKG